MHDPLDYVSPVPVHELGSTADYLRALDGFQTKFPPDERFSYSNGGYVVLALIAERASGTPFHELVVQRVCEPAGMVDTAFLRSDELPGRTALGYLAEDGPRTNVFHLPVRGSGDGGIYTTASDVSALWTALFAGRIVSTDLVTEMVQPRSEAPSPTQPARYGLGMGLHPSDDRVELARIGRGRVLPDRLRPERALHLHGPFEHDRGGVAHRPASRRAHRVVTCKGVSTPGFRQ